LVAEAANGSSQPVSSIVLDADGLPHRREINDKAPGGCAGCWQLYLRYSRIRRWGLKCVDLQMLGRAFLESTVVEQCRCGRHLHYPMRLTEHTLWHAG